MKTSELTGAALDWAVAKCKQDELGALNSQYPPPEKIYPKRSFSTDWELAGPIIESEKIELAYDGDDDNWAACHPCIRPKSKWWRLAKTPLVAAMRCFVAAKLGDDVEIPDEFK